MSRDDCSSSLGPRLLMGCQSQGHQALLVEQTMYTLGHWGVVFLSRREEDLNKGRHRVAQKEVWSAVHKFRIFCFDSLGEVSGTVDTPCEHRGAYWYK